MNITTNDKQLAERAAKLTPLSQLIREMEQAELKSKEQWAWCAIQLGDYYSQAKDIWCLSKGERTSWASWMGKHSSHNIRTIQVYMEMHELYSAADETQRAAFLSRGSIRGFLDVAKGPVAEAVKSSPVWLSICDSVEKWRDKYLAHAGEFTPEGTEKLRNDIAPIAEKLWPEKFTVAQG